MESHLLQMRGLKQEDIDKKWTAIGVASFTDAWIETDTSQPIASAIRSHLLQMRGLKQSYIHKIGLRQLSHLLQMRGLKLYK